jgi:phage-related protein
MERHRAVEPYRRGHLPTKAIDRRLVRHGCCGWTLPHGYQAMAVCYAGWTLALAMAKLVWTVAGTTCESGG